MACYLFLRVLMIVVVVVVVDVNAKISGNRTHITHLWELYKNSTSTWDKIQIANELRQILANTSYADSRIVISGLILFGPQNDRSLLSMVREPLVDDLQCLESTLNSFKKHCGLPTEHHLNYMRAFGNMCHYVADKKAIEEAFILACGMEKLEPYGIVLGNPAIKVTPAPISDSSVFCGRAVVKGKSRRHFKSFAKAYFLLVVPSFRIPHDWLNTMVQICLHKNVSLGLCQCKKDDWISVQKGSWSPAVTPYGKTFVDVKFVGGNPGFVTVSLEEVTQGWRYVLLAVGIALLIIAPIVSKCIMSGFVHDRVAQFIKWVIGVIAVTSIFLSSIDTPCAAAAVTFCLGLIGGFYHLRSYKFRIFD